MAWRILVVRNETLRQVPCVDRLFPAVMGSVLSRSHDSCVLLLKALNRLVHDREGLPPVGLLWKMSDLPLLPHLFKVGAARTFAELLSHGLKITHGLDGLPPGERPGTPQKPLRVVILLHMMVGDGSLDFVSNPWRVLVRRVAEVLSLIVELRELDVGLKLLWAELGAVVREHVVHELTAVFPRQLELLRVFGDQRQHVGVHSMDVLDRPLEVVMYLSIVCHASPNDPRGFKTAPPNGGSHEEGRRESVSDEIKDVDDGSKCALAPSSLKGFKDGRGSRC